MTIGLALLALRSVFGDPIDLVPTILGGLAVGAALSLSTGAGRPFRRISAVPVAVGASLFGSLLLTRLGSVTPSSLRALLIVTIATASLDLCWVSRVRFHVILSGFPLSLLVVAEPREAITWAIVWLATFLLTFWLLEGDVERSLRRPRPRTAIDGPFRRRPVDLLRIAGIALVSGTLGILLLGGVRCSPESFEGLARHLPWPDRLPDLPFDWFLDEDRDLPVVDLEIDRFGHEVRNQIDRHGRRFVIGPTGEVLAVVEVDGLDRYVDEDGTLRARYRTDGTLAVPRPDGDDVIYERDDHGWFLDVDGVEHRVELDEIGTGVELLDPDGRIVARDHLDDRFAIVGNGTSDPLAERVGSRFPAPPAAVILGTSGLDPVVTRDGGDITIVDRTLPNRRVYHPYGPLGTDLRVELDLDEGSGLLAFEFDSSRRRLTVFEDGDELGSVRIDREGDVFDPPPDRAADLRQRLLIVSGIVLFVVLVLVGARLLRRRRDGVVGLDDRAWAADQVRRLDRFGRRRGIERGADVTVIGHGAELARWLEPDSDRFPDIASDLDRALHGPAPFTPAERDRLIAEIDEAFTAHRRVRRRDRRRRLAERAKTSEAAGAVEERAPDRPETPVGAGPSRR